MLYSFYSLITKKIAFCGAFQVCRKANKKQKIFGYFPISVFFLSFRDNSCTGICYTFTRLKNRISVNLQYNTVLLLAILYDLLPFFQTTDLLGIFHTLFGKLQLHTKKIISPLACDTERSVQARWKPNKEQNKLGYLRLCAICLSF